VKFMSDGSLVLSHGDGAHSNFVDAGGNDPLGFGPGKFGPEQDLGAFRALEVTSMAGKVLRIDPETGLGLPDNPFFTGNPADAASRVWALGLRNPFRFTLVPGTGPREALFACGRRQHGVGGARPLPRRRELRLALLRGRAGDARLSSGRRERLLRRGRGTDRGAVAVLEPLDAGQHRLRRQLRIGRLRLHGNELSAHLPRCALLLRLRSELDEGRPARSRAEPRRLFSFGTEMGSPIEIVREPESGDLVYISLDHPRQVYPLRYTPSNQPPVAVAKASPPWGPSPLTVHLSASGSYDPENDTLDYHWDLGDGAISTSPELDHVYYDSSTYVVVLTVTDDFGLTDTETIVLNPDDTPPVIVSVATPADGDVYEEGVPIELDCAVADAEDDAKGILLRWNGPST
jgi:hypothetical protein